MNIEKVPFIRLEGCGNNFMVIHDLERSLLSAVPDIALFSRKLQERSFGWGGDGVLYVTRTPRGLFEMVGRNPDGSAMGMCGNGIRCVTRSLYMTGTVAPTAISLEFEVEGRKIICDSSTSGKMVRVNMGKPSFAPKEVPLSIDHELTSHPVSIEDQTFNITTVSMGNPHCVIPVERLTDVNFENFGPLLENHKLFPERANVEFVETITSQHFKVLVWERGVGPTLACGTGACAVVVAMNKLGRTGANATVSLPGGDLQVELQGGAVYLTGPARELGEGMLSSDFIERCMRE